jgi:excisionase family DNA binding protein
MSITVTLMIGGQPLEAVLDDAALAAVAAAVTLIESEPASELLTVNETAEFLRCNRQRVYDLTSSRRLPKVMDGARPLIRRADLLAYLQDGANERRDR